MGSLSLPEGVEIISDSAFEDCYNLKNVRLPNSLKEIGRDAFFRTSKLTKILIGADVEMNSSFDYCFSGFYKDNGRKAGWYELREDTRWDFGLAYQWVYLGE
jgi:hypothetical protein